MCHSISTEWKNIRDDGSLQAICYYHYPKRRLFILSDCYNVTELNYPKKYLQAIGAFGWFVLEDKYYKLGSRVSRIVSNLLKKHY